MFHEFILPFAFVQGKRGRRLGKKVIIVAKVFA